MPLKAICGDGLRPSSQSRFPVRRSLPRTPSLRAPAPATTVNPRGRPGFERAHGLRRPLSSPPFPSRAPPRGERLADGSRFFRKQVISLPHSSPPTDSPLITLDCRIERIRYQAPDSPFVIVTARTTAEPHESITLTGPIADTLPPAGHLARCYGTWRTHPRYGRQFTTRAVSEPPPETTDALERYLVAAHCPQLGPRLAHRLVETFEMHTLDYLRTDPDTIATLPRVSLARARAWQTFFQDHHAVESLMLWLLSLDLDPGLAQRLYQTFGAQAMDHIYRNPYVLTSAPWSVAFPTIDRIALAQGWPPLGRARLTALWHYLVQQHLGRGDCTVPTDTLAAHARTFLTRSGSPAPEAQAALAALLPVFARHPDLVWTDSADHWALRGIDRLEHQLAQRIAAHRHTALPLLPEPPTGWLATTLHVVYDPAQESALHTALTHPFSLLTGGPGTGKTTIVRGLLHWLTTTLQIPPTDLLCAAPTARAAHRLAHVTGHSATTIHRLLGWQPDGFAHHHDAPLSGQWLFVDETSMLDLPLAAALWDAIPPTMHVVWLGDPEQLPSVGPGAVLRDLLQDATMPVTVLSHNFRSDSGVNANAHRTRQGQAPLSTPDFWWHAYPRAIDPFRVQQDLLRILDRLTRHAPWQAIQVLTPIHSGPLGTDALNALLRHRWNPPTATTPTFIGTRQRPFAPGDRVMHLRNDYDRQVFNGDIGWVTACVPATATESAHLMVQFDDRPPLAYTAAETRWLDWAYASTIHKAQGAEYPIVVLLIFWDSARVLSRNLLYTAITRAQQRVVLLTESGAWEQGLELLHAHERHTGLARYWASPPVATPPAPPQVSTLP